MSRGPGRWCNSTPAEGFVGGCGVSTASGVAFRATRTSDSTRSMVWSNWSMPSAVTLCGRPHASNLVGEPDAVISPVRFDEREVKTGHGRIVWHWPPKGPATSMADLTHRVTSRLYSYGLPHQPE